MGFLNDYANGIKEKARSTLEAAGEIKDKFQQAALEAKAKQTTVNGQTFNDDGTLSDASRSQYLNSKPSGASGSWSPQPSLIEQGFQKLTQLEDLITSGDRWQSPSNNSITEYAANTGLGIARTGQAAQEVFAPDDASITQRLVGVKEWVFGGLADYVNTVGVGKFAAAGGGKAALAGYHTLVGPQINETLEAWQPASFTGKVAKQTLHLANTLPEFMMAGEITKGMDFLNLTNKYANTFVQNFALPFAAMAIVGRGEDLKSSALFAGSFGVSDVLSNAIPFGKLAKPFLAGSAGYLSEKALGALEMRKIDKEFDYSPAWINSPERAQMEREIDERALTSAVSFGTFSALHTAVSKQDRKAFVRDTKIDYEATKKGAQGFWNSLGSDSRSTILNFMGYGDGKRFLKALGEGGKAFYQERRRLNMDGGMFGGETAKGPELIPVKNLKTEVEYQPRMQPYAEGTAKRIETEGYRAEEFTKQPFEVWERAPGEFVVLSGHSRTEGLRRLGENAPAEVPAIIHRGITKQQAKDIAARGNQTGVSQTILDNAKSMWEAAKEGRDNPVHPGNLVPGFKPEHYKAAWEMFMEKPRAITEAIKKGAVPAEDVLFFAREGASLGLKPETTARVVDGLFEGNGTVNRRDFLQRGKVVAALLKRAQADKELGSLFGEVELAKLETVVLEKVETLVRELEKSQAAARELKNAFEKVAKATKLSKKQRDAYKETIKAEQEISEQIKETMHQTVKRAVEQQQTIFDAKQQPEQTGTVKEQPKAKAEQPAREDSRSVRNRLGIAENKALDQAERISKKVVVKATQKDKGNVPPNKHKPRRLVNFGQYGPVITTTGWQLLKKRIKDLSEGASGESKRLVKLKKEIAKYARQTLKKYELRKSEITPIMTEIAKATDKKGLDAAMDRIETAAENSVVRAAAKKITKLGKKALKSQSVSVEMKEKIRKLLGENEKGLSREKVLGLLEDMMLVVGHGKALEAERQTLKKLQKEIAIEAINREAVNLDGKSEMAPEIGERLSLRESIANMFTNIAKGIREFDRNILTIDRVFDMIDGSVGYVGATYRIFKGQFDMAYEKYQVKRNAQVAELAEIRNRNKLEKADFDAIGVYAIMQQKGGRERLLQGYTEAQLKAFEEKGLNEKQMEWYTKAREILDRERPEIERIMKEEYNQELGKVENYFPFHTDWAKMENSTVSEQIIEAGSMLGKSTDFLSKTAEKGFTEDRQSKAKTRLNVNAEEIMMKHVDNVSYFVETAPTIKRNFEIANDQRFADAAGKDAQRFVLEWIDLLAKKGGGANRSRWIDVLNQNVGAAILGFKVSTVIAQFTQIPEGMMTLGVRPMAEGFKAWAIGHGKYSSGEVQAFVYDNFGQIRRRTQDKRSQFLDYQPELKPETKAGEAAERARELSYWGIHLLDSRISAASAFGAYVNILRAKGKEVDLKNPDTEAIAEAERQVRLGQGSADFKDMPLFLSKGRMGKKSGNVSIVRAITKFQSFIFNRWGVIRHDMINRGIMDVSRGDAAEAALRATNILIFLSLSQAMYAALTKETGEMLDKITGGTGESAYDDGFWKRFALEQAGVVPLLGNVVGAFRYDTTMMGPAAEAIADITANWKALADLSDEASDGSKMRKITDAIAGTATVFGVPGTLQITQLTKKFINNNDPERMEKDERERIKMDMEKHGIEKTKEKILERGILADNVEKELARAIENKYEFDDTPEPEDYLKLSTKMTPEERDTYLNSVSESKREELLKWNIAENYPQVDEIDLGALLGRDEATEAQLKAHQYKVNALAFAREGKTVGTAFAEQLKAAKPQLREVYAGANDLQIVLTEIYNQRVNGLLHSDDVEEALKALNITEDIDGIKTITNPAETDAEEFEAVLMSI